MSTYLIIELFTFFSLPFLIVTPLCLSCTVSNLSQSYPIHCLILILIPFFPWMPDDMFDLLDDIKGLLSFLVFPFFFLLLILFVLLHLVSFTSKPIFSRCPTLNTTLLHTVFFCFILLRPGRYLFSTLLSFCSLPVALHTILAQHHRYPLFGQP